MSISACVQAAGASGGTDASASAWTARAVGGAPSSAVDPGQHPPDVGVDRADRDAERDRRHRARRVRADARERLERRDVGRDPSAVVARR